MSPNDVEKAKFWASEKKSCIMRPTNKSTSNKKIIPGSINWKCSNKSYN